MIFRDILAPLAFSKTLLRVSSLAIAVGLYSTLSVWQEASSSSGIGYMPSQFHAAMSLTLSCLLVFRTNSAYSRWWEARTLWGMLVNATRNLSIKLTCIIRLSEHDNQFLQTRIIEFPTALMSHLRIAPPSNSDPRADRGTSDGNHRPAFVVQQLYDWLAIQKSNGRLDGDEMRIIDVELAKFLEVCGGCERIARTPMVRSYRIFARQCIFLFLLTLPWGIVSDFHWWTIPLSTITAYFMIGMEVVAEHVEEPFGIDEDDLDLNGLCNTIKFSVEEIFASKSH